MEDWNHSELNSAAAKPVDPRELLVYKVLEHLGVGCETFFFSRSLEDFYFATLDAGHEEGSSFSTRNWLSHNKR